MKLTIHGPLSGRDWNGQLVGWAPDTLVEVDDRDEKQVAWARGRAATPYATLVEDAPAPEPVKEPAKAAKEPAKAAKEPPRPEPHAARAEPPKPSAPSGRQGK